MFIRRMSHGVLYSSRAVERGFLRRCDQRAQVSGPTQRLGEALLRRLGGVRRGFRVTVRSGPRRSWQGPESRQMERNLRFHALSRATEGGWLLLQCLRQLMESGIPCA